jgi:hypothetical protein
LIVNFLKVLMKLKKLNLSETFSIGLNADSLTAIFYKLKQKSILKLNLSKLLLLLLRPINVNWKMISKDGLLVKVTLHLLIVRKIKNTFKLKLKLLHQQLLKLINVNWKMISKDGLLVKVTLHLLIVRKIKNTFKLKLRLILKFK